MDSDGTICAAPHGKSNTVITFGGPLQIFYLLMEVIGMVNSISRSFFYNFDIRLPGLASEKYVTLRQERHVWR